MTERWQKRRGEKVVARLGLVCATLILAATACLYDNEHKCGPRQVFDEGLLYCVCDQTSVLKDGACSPCGANEVPQNGACACKQGFVRGGDGACHENRTRLGQSCTPGAACDDPKYTFCATGAGGTGYCTQAGCTSTADCPSDYTCATWEAQPFCKRSPTGFLKACMSTADCAGNDADFCEPLQSHRCLMSNCKVSPNTCTGGQLCCDLGKFGLPTLCVPPGSCPN